MGRMAQVASGEARDAAEIRLRGAVAPCCLAEHFRALHEKTFRWRANPRLADLTPAITRDLAKDFRPLIDACAAFCLIAKSGKIICINGKKYASFQLLKF